MSAKDERTIEEGDAFQEDDNNQGCTTMMTVTFTQKLIAELIGTFFLVFAGCASVTVNLSKGSVTLVGIGLVWGLAVLVIVYSVGHVSGAHLNPAVTIAFATCGRFPWIQVPAYVVVQLVASLLASGALRLLFGGKREHYYGTIPTGSNMQSFVLEIITTFYLMFVISGVATDTRAVGELAGLAIGSTILLNVLISGPISGGSMNPARSLGPAIIEGRYQSIWVYIVAPVLGAILGAWAYNLIRHSKKPMGETPSFFKLVRNSSTKK